MLRHGDEGFTVSGAARVLAVSKGGVFRALQLYERRELLSVRFEGKGTWDRTVFATSGLALRAVASRRSLAS